MGAVGYVGARAVEPLPALGSLVDPAHGIWVAARAATPAPSAAFRSSIFADSVLVAVDRRGVPHLFASEELDLYRALGFLVARDRLFQLELQTRAAAGTLTELLGPRALPMDREARKLGFGRYIERMAGDTTSPSARSIRAYAEGINAWLDRMTRAELPIEFRLLGARPSRWRPENSLYLLGRMAVILALNDASLLKAEAAARVGWAAADAVFPVNAPIQVPIQPFSPDSGPFQPPPIPGPGRPATDAVALAKLGEVLAQALGAPDRIDRAADLIGSNNWAVAAARTRNGYPLLAGDPHLELTLPSVWYQAHLVVPGMFDVSGVTLVGAPWVIIGFNRSIAWSLTNTGADVNDYYRETIDDPAAPTRYQLDGTWRPIENRVEAYRDQRGRVLAIDTVRFTHRGPLLRVDSLWLSMAWTAFDSTEQGKQFLAINRARTVEEFLAGSAGFGAPAQNMVVADQRGAIAIRSTGRFPIRPGAGRGDVIQEGRISANDWAGSLPVGLYPFSFNAARGFVFSANQQPVDPRTNSLFLGAHWENPWRAMRIERLLRADSQATPETMARHQTDPVSERARAFLPYLLGQAADSGRRAAAPPAAKAARDLLRGWDGGYPPDDHHPVLFEAVMAEIARLTWDELATAGPLITGRRFRPADAVLLTLMHDSLNPWWDLRSTARLERRDDIIDAALASGLDTTTRRHGNPGPGWRWGSVHHANIHHLLRLPALSALDLEVTGGPGTLSPSSGSGIFGASWRMVVELAPTVRAWAIYPGGQSGQPASRHYRDLLPRWLAGELDSLPFPGSIDDLPADQVESRIRLSGSAR
jgi:penicillin amidase